jgi:hypothetical protein
LGSREKEDLSKRLAPRSRIEELTEKIAHIQEEKGFGTGT